MAEINKFMFRDYDIRGVAGEDLNPREAELIGKAFGTYCQEHGEKKVIISRDARLSSPGLTDALVKGITSTGCNVVDAGIASHGLFLYAMRHLDIGTGCYVTASHNPAQDNGFKFALKFEYVGGKSIGYMHDLIKREAFKQGSGVGMIDATSVIEDYLTFLKSKFKLKRKLKVVIDCGNGMAGLVAPRLFKEMGCELIELYCDVDCTFPNHIPDPVMPENLRDIVEEVKKQKADFGIAFDGDGDRIAAIDEKGAMLWGDQVTAIFAKKALKEHPGGKIVFHVVCSQALSDLIRNYGGIPIETRVGHTNIENAIRKEKALVGGEISGHVFLAENGYTDDMVYAACLMLQIASEADGPFSSLLADYPKYYATPEYRTPCPDNVKFQLVDKIVNEFKQEGYNVLDIDGAKVIFEDGWGIVRASNTVPKLAMRFEGKTPEAAQRIKKLFLEKLTAHGVDVSSAK